MADIEIPIDAGTSKRLLTAGKYCDKNILVTASGGATSPVIEPLEVTTNGTYTAPEGVDGYSPVTVNVSGGGMEYVNLNVNLSQVNIDLIYKNTEFDAIQPLHTYESVYSQECLSPKNSIIKLESGNINVSESDGLELVKQEGAGIKYYKIVGNDNNSATLRATGGSGGGGMDFISDAEALNIITGGEQI